MNPMRREAVQQLGDIASTMLQTSDWAQSCACSLGFGEPKQMERPSHVEREGFGSSPACGRR
jgi:hypothetical protein